jgi:hypothetical protein
MNMDKAAMPLSQDQMVAVDAFRAFLSSDTPVFMLKGYAGTGKTYLTRVLLDMIEEGRWEVRLMAPTGRAARIVKERTGSDATTIHKGIYNMDRLEEIMTIKGGKPVYKFVYGLTDTEPSIDTMIIVDESSMVSDRYSDNDFFVFGSGRLLADLMRHLAPVNEGRRIKIIFIGDPAQLPPVGDDKSGALMGDYLRSAFGARSSEAWLRQVMRQGGESGILRIAGYLRGQLEDPRRNAFDLEVGGGDAAEIAREDVIERFVDVFGREGAESVILIHHRNRDAHDSNIRIRALLFPGEPSVRVGDRLIIAQNNYNYPVELLNGTFVTVKAVHGGRILKQGLKSYLADGTDVMVDLTYRSVTLEVPDTAGHMMEQDCMILESFLDADRSQPLYEENVAAYLDFKMRHPQLKPRTKEFRDALRSDPFFNALKVKYGYAITCHKSQGGEWPTVLVDMQMNQSRLSDYFLRWAYTAVTRASRRLWLYNIPRQSPYAKLEYRPLVLTTKGPMPDPETHATELVLTEAQLSFRKASGLDGALPFIRDRYHRLLVQLQGTDVEVMARESFAWMEKYGFRSGGRVTWLSFHYNGKNMFTKVSDTGGKPTDAVLSAQLRACVERPVHYRLVEQGVDTMDGKSAGEVNTEHGVVDVAVFGEGQEHLEAFHGGLSERLGVEGIRVEGVFHEQWRERYALRRGEERAVVIFHHDASNRITSGWPLPGDCNSQALLDAVGSAVMDLING